MRLGCSAQLLVAIDGVKITVSSARQRALLARMALAGGQPVGVERLVEDVWGEASDSVLNTLQVTISSLRKLLGPTSIPDRRPSVRVR